MPWPPRVRKCSVPSCNDVTSKRHRFPKNNEVLMKQWLEKVNHPRFKLLGIDQIYGTYVVCESHFSKDCFVPGTRRGLMCDAVPSLNLGDENYSEDDCILNLPTSFDLNSVRVKEETSEDTQNENLSRESQNTESAQPEACSNLYLSEQDNEAEEATAVDLDDSVLDHSSYEEETVAVKTDRPDIEWINPDVKILETLGIQNWVRKETVQEDTESTINTIDRLPEESLNKRMAALPSNLGILLSSKETMCRFCLGTEEVLHPLFDKTSGSDTNPDDCREAILSSVPIKVEENDGLPQFMCESCYNSLVSWHTFREMCVSTNIILRQYVSNMSLTEKSKNDTQQNSIQSSSIPNASRVMTKESIKSKAEGVSSKQSSVKSLTPNMSNSNDAVICVSDEEDSSVECSKKKSNLINRKPPLILKNRQPKRIYSNIGEILSTPNSKIRRVSSKISRSKHELSKKTKNIATTSKRIAKIVSSEKQNLPKSSHFLNSVQDGSIILMNNKQYYTIAPGALDPHGSRLQPLLLVDPNDDSSVNVT